MVCWFIVSPSRRIIFSCKLISSCFRSVTVIVIGHKSSGRNYLVNNNRNSKLRIKDDTATASRFVWLSPEFLCYDGPGSSSTVHHLLNETRQTSALFNAVLKSELIDVMSAPWVSDSEQGMGQWVMGHGSNGSRKSDGSHGSWVTRCWPMTQWPMTMTHQFFNSMAGLIYAVSQKNVPPLACYNFDACEWIWIFFWQKCYR